MSWETTKIKSDVKGTAKEIDGATFTEIMQMGITAYQEGLVNTDGEVVTDQPEPSEFGQVATVEDLEQLKNELSMANEPGVEVDTEQMMARLDELEQALKTEIEALQAKQ